MLIRCYQSEFRSSFCNLPSILNALLFFLVMVTVFPLATAADVRSLSQLGPGVIWTCALLSMLLSMPQFFSEDYQNGRLDHWIMVPMPLSYYVLVKVCVHGLLLVLPLILLVPLTGLLYALSGRTIMLLMSGLLLGAPSLLLLAALLAALTVQLSRSALLVLLMALPLYVPILVFGSLAATSLNHALLLPLASLSAILLLFVTLIPISTAACLKLATRFPP